MELALSSPHFSDVDVEEPDRSFDVRHLADTTALQAAMQ
jgi:hypothetical protein